MSGFRQVGNLLVPNGTEEITILSSEIESNLPLNVTVFPTGISQGAQGSLNAQLTLEENTPGLPIITDDFGVGLSEKITYQPSVSNIKYNVDVSSLNGTTGPYLLEVSSEDANNDFPFSAVFIGNVPDKPLVNGFVGRSDTDDWFNFQVPSNGGVRITLDATDDNAQLDLFEIQNGAQGNQIGAARAGVGSSGSITQNLTTGNYLLRVTPSNNSANLPDGGQSSTKYTLTVDQVTGSPGDGSPGDGSSRITQDVIRFWDFTAQSHIFTSNQEEIDLLTGQSNFFRREGNEFDVPVNEGSPIFRYVNSLTNTELLTFDSQVPDILPQFRSLGVAFNAYTENNKPIDAIPIYRLKNNLSEQTNPLNITHFFTSDSFNRDVVLRDFPFSDEGVGFWALPSSTDGLVR